MNLQQALAEIGKLRDSGALADALAALRPLLASHPRDVAVHRHVAETCEQMGDYANAAVSFNTMLEIRPTAIAAMIGLGRLARHKQAWEEMLLWFERAAEVDPANINCYCQRADALLALQRRAEAEAILRAGLTQQPDNPDLSRRMLQLLLDDKNYARVENLSRALLQHKTDIEWLWRMHLRALREQKKRKELLQASERALQALPLSSSLLSGHVTLLHNFGYYAAAQDYARRLYPYISENAQALYAWCQLQLNLGQTEKIRTTLQAMQADGDSAMEANKLLFHAKSAQLEGDYAAAEHYLLKLLALQPHHEEGESLLAETHFLRFDLDALQAMPNGGRLKLQIRNDAALFPAEFAAMQLATASSGDHSELVLAAAAVVHKTPQCGLPLHYWLRHLGHATALFKQNTVSTIPHRIWQYWHGDVPSDVDASMTTWRNDPTFADYHLFDAEQAYTRLQPYIKELDHASFIKLNARVQSDLLRWVVLYEEGGVWINADCVRRHPLPASLFEGRSLLLIQNHLGYLDTSFVAAAPGHRLLRRTLDYALEAALAQPEIPHSLTSGHTALAMACATEWGEELMKTGQIDGAALLSHYQLKPHVALTVPHDYHRLAHIPTEILTRFSRVPFGAIRSG